MTTRFLSAAGVRVPSFLYGTAWKEERTQAADRGWPSRPASAASTRRTSAGTTTRPARARRSPGRWPAGLVRRDELFLQTKFTSVEGQDHRLPYDPGAHEARAGAPVVRRARSSTCSVETIDSYVLHGPSQRYGLADADREAWRAMEELHAAGRTRLLGVSNVGLDQLEELCASATTPPAFVQNRCYARLRLGPRGARVLPGARDRLPGLLAAHREPRRAWRDPRSRPSRSGSAATPAQVVFRFALQVGMLPLTGTSDPAHMREDLLVYEFALSAEDVRLIENLLTGP